MSAPREADLIILGGGCAGLSLAVNLADIGINLRVIVVEPRTSYHEDRTWCGWRLAPHAFEDCIIASWNRWQIATPAGVVERSSELYPYEMIRSDLFYEKACGVIHRHPAMSLLKGLSANVLSEFPDHVQVGLSDGHSISAPWVIDTRPAKRIVKHPWLWQNFVGFVVEVDVHNDVHLGRVPVLMDFQSPGECVAQFMYILPIGDREFLCEWTQFAETPGHQEDIEASLRNWLQQHAGAGWIMHRQEQGSLPMALAPSNSADRIIAAGTRGGSMRASTGYAFHSIQRWACACAASLKAAGSPIEPARDWMLDTMDAVFFEVLQQPSTSAAEIFRCLFENSSPDSLVRFLSGIPSRSDLWAVMRGLPWAKFLRAAPSALRSQICLRDYPHAYSASNPRMQPRSRT